MVIRPFLALRLVTLGIREFLETTILATVTNVSLDIPEQGGVQAAKEERAMLVLSRRMGSSIVISDNITVTVLEVRGSRVKLGISAPVDAPIRRGEVHEKRHGSISRATGYTFRIAHVAMYRSNCL